jgi:hypothetical protein
VTVDAPPLTHYGRITGSVFDLLGRGEVDLTAAVGWTLSASPTLMARLLELLDLEGPPEAVAVSLESADEAGRTDIELTSPTWKVVIEAKQGWLLPDEIQLRKYVGRFAGFEGLLLTMSDSSVAWASHFPAEIDGVPVRHEPWDSIRALLRDARSAARPRERLWLEELESYMGTVTSMRPADDQWTYCVVVSDALFGGVSFRDYITRQRRYFHPYGGRNGWPKRPPNLLAFRWGGRVRQVNRVEAFDIRADLREIWPEMTPDEASEPHIVYRLGPDIPIPEISTNGTYASARVWCLLDQLLTQQTLKAAKDMSDHITRQR